MIGGMHSLGVDVRPLVAERIPLARGTEAFERAARPGALKVLLEA